MTVNVSIHFQWSVRRLNYVWRTVIDRNGSLASLRQMHRRWSVGSSLYPWCTFIMCTWPTNWIDTDRATVIHWRQNWQSNSSLERCIKSHFHHNHYSACPVWLCNLFNRTFIKFINWLTPTSCCKMAYHTNTLNNQLDTETQKYIFNLGLLKKCWLSGNIGL